MRNLLSFVALCVTLAFLQSCNTKAPDQPNIPAIALPQPIATKVTSMVVHLPKAEPKVWEVESVSAMSVKDLMDALNEAQFVFSDTLYPGMGHLVTSVAGIKNAGSEGEYWQFCIDNVASDRGVDEKLVAPGQRVDWHYTKYGELPCKKIGE